jgi:hypothetical protein
MYTSVFTFTSVKGAISLVGNEMSIPGFILNLLYSLLGLSFAVLTGTFMFSLICEISRNETSIEQLKKRKRDGYIGGEDLGCVKNWEEVFGGAERWWTWLLPTRPFVVGDDRELLFEDYSDDVL